MDITAELGFLGAAEYVEAFGTSLISFLFANTASSSYYR